MQSPLSRREEAETSDVARKVGGYSELLRLEAELRQLERSGITGRIVRDGSTGRFQVVG